MCYLLMSCNVFSDPLSDPTLAYVYPKRAYTLEGPRSLNKGGERYYLETYSTS